MYQNHNLLRTFGSILIIINHGSWEKVVVIKVNAHEDAIHSNLVLILTLTKYIFLQITIEMTTVNSEHERFFIARKMLRRRHIMKERKEKRDFLRRKMQRKHDHGIPSHILEYYDDQNHSNKSFPIMQISEEE